MAAEFCLSVSPSYLKESSTCHKISHQADSYISPQRKSYYEFLYSALGQVWTRMITITLPRMTANTYYNLAKCEQSVSCLSFIKVHNYQIMITPRIMPISFNLELCARLSQHSLFLRLHFCSKFLCSFPKLQLRAW